MTYLKEMVEQGYNVESVGTFYRIMIPHLVGSLIRTRNDLIVDVGAGHGHWTIPLKDAGYSNIAIIDIEDVNFDLFVKSYQFQCFKCDVQRDCFPIGDGEAELVIGSHLIEHLNDPTNFLKESFRVLSLGGTIILVTPNWRKQYRTFYRDPTHVHPYDREGIARLLRITGFTDIATQSWGSSYGLGRLQAYRWIPRLGMIGKDLLAIGRKG
jgi:2-polyprenyl-3-methyl-5-hydroxy-6-metoxy-1,4-benzoquinol methylase